MLVRLVVSSYYSIPMTEVIYNITVTQIIENDKNSSLISNAWYILKANPHA
jgi:hypothetical protein